MIRANRQFFVVRIDKKMQEQKRNNLVSHDIGFLGIKHSEQDDDDKIDGVRVWDVEKDSPAYEAAFKHNDIITQINGKKVTSYSQLVDQLSLYAPDTTIEINYINSFSLDQKEELTKKVTLAKRKHDIVLPPQIVDFQFNLQFGEIVEIGKIAGQQFPEALIGDVLIFHHTVEHKPRTDGEAMYHDFHLIETDENGDEYRIVNFAHELFGVLKLNEGIIIPYKNFVFCHRTIRKSSFQKNAAGIWLPDHWEASEQDLLEQLEEMKAHVTEIASSTVMREQTDDTNYRKKEEVLKQIAEINLKRRELTKKLHQRKFVELTCLFIHPETCKELQTEIVPGDTLIADYNTLYPLDMFGQQYTLLRKDYIELLINKN